LKRDRTGWTREVEKMINWGAYVPTGRKEELIDYLVKSFSNSSTVPSLLGKIGGGLHD
jgi:hypothetical protein